MPTDKPDTLCPLAVQVANILKKSDMPFAEQVAAVGAIEEFMFMASPPIRARFRDLYGEQTTEVVFTNRRALMDSGKL